MGPKPDGFEPVVLDHAGSERGYLLRIPRPISESPVPLVVQLHGRGIGPAMFDRWTGFGELADEAGFALAMPSAIREIWNDGRYGDSTWNGHIEVDDVGFLLAVIDDVIEHHAIDPARVYLVGMSNGATMAGRVAWERPDRIAAVAQVAGTGAVGLISEHRPTVPVPLLQIHGTRDRFAPYAGGRAGHWLRLFGRRPIVPNVSVDEWARVWVERNAAADTPLVEAVAPDITVRRWRGPGPASDVAFYRVEGGGHTWPGARIWIPPHLGRVSHSMDAARVIWSFFLAHAGVPALEGRALSGDIGER